MSMGDFSHWVSVIRFLLVVLVMVTCEAAFDHPRRLSFWVPIPANVDFSARSSSREDRIRVPFLFSVGNFSRGTLPQKKLARKGTTGGT